MICKNDQSASELEFLSLISWKASTTLNTGTNKTTTSSFSSDWNKNKWTINSRRIPLLSAFLTKCRQEKFVSLYHRRHNIVPECKSVNSSIYWGRALAKAYLLKMEICQIYTISLFFKNYEWSLTKIYDSTTLLY